MAIKNHTINLEKEKEEQKIRDYYLKEEIKDLAKEYAPNVFGTIIAISSILIGMYAVNSPDILIQLAGVGSILFGVKFPIFKRRLYRTENLMKLTGREIYE